VTERRTVLLTGAAGVVGNALLARWRHHRVVCLVHRTTVARNAEARPVEVVSGDLGRPDLGLDADVRRRLVEKVDAVVHCAAVTDFNADPVEVDRINVGGTRAIVDFAAEANATVHYLSTAFVARADHALEDTGDAAADPGPYLASKRSAEQVIRSAGVPATIVRPSVVIGDSRTGEMAKFQGLHTLATAILRGTLPLVPLRVDDRIDMVPQDRLADAITSLIDSDTTSGEFWITAGEQALTARAAVDLTARVGRRMGLAVEAPRLVEPDMVNRLIRPVFVEPLPKPARRRFDDLVAMAALCTTTSPLPSNVDQVPGGTPLTAADVATAYERSIEYLAHRKGLTQTRSAA
jgi:thioester reductase-like protein